MVQNAIEEQEKFLKEKRARKSVTSPDQRMGDFEQGKL